MLNRLPRRTPQFRALIADVCPTSTDAEIAEALGVSTRTVSRWKKTGAPRMALLALWWLSRWGHSAWDAEMSTRSEIAWTVVTAWARQGGHWPPGGMLSESAARTALYAGGTQPGQARESPVRVTIAFAPPPLPPPREER